MDAPWVLIVFSVPEAIRNRRAELRTILANRGFGFVASGVAIAPENALASALTLLRARDLDQFIQVFTVNYRSERGLRERIRDWWDLTDIDDGYRVFLAEYSPIIEAWRERPRDLATSGEYQRDAFSTLVPLVTRWRRFPYSDPNIPLEILPVGWKAPRAKLLFFELHDLTRDAALVHARRALHASRAA